MRPGVFITVDVECSMGGAWADESLRPVSPARGILGEYGGRPLGLPLIVDILRGAGLAATFFVEPFAEEQGYPGELEPICWDLIDRGQDVQLHVHPNCMHYGLHRQGKGQGASDYFADLAPDEQLELLRTGCDRLEAWTGSRPVAFRAGNMGASEDVLEQVARAGIPIDSSYTFCYAGGQCRFRPEEPYNGSKWYGQVLELALSGFYQPRLPGLHPAKPLDIVGISFEECRDAIEQTCRAGADAVVILHSFSLFKVRNVQYDGGRLNRIVRRRFARLCAWLAASAEEHPTYVFGELPAAIAEGDYQARAVPPCRLATPVRAVTRKAVQLLNNLYWT